MSDPLITSNSQEDHCRVCAEPRRTPVKRELRDKQRYCTEGRCVQSHCVGCSVLLASAGPADCPCATRVPTILRIGLMPWGAARLAWKLDRYDAAELDGIVDDRGVAA